MKIVVSAGLLISGAQFLAARRPAGKPYAGFWELPGGKLKPPESPREALCRELEEELDIHVVNAELLTTYLHPAPQNVIELHFFLVASFSGEPRAREGQELRWIEHDKVDDFQFLPADHKFMRECITPGLFAALSPQRFNPAASADGETRPHNL